MSKSKINSPFESASVYPDALRRISYLDIEMKKRLKLPTNNSTLPALTIAQIQIALADRVVLQMDQAALANQSVLWQHRKRSQDPDVDRRVSLSYWFAIVRKRLTLNASLHQIVQILSVTLFGRTPVLRHLRCPIATPIQPTAAPKRFSSTFNRTVMPCTIGGLWGLQPC